jgi:hypothetical protein
MAQQFNLTNLGMKGVNLLTSNDPDVWSGLGAMSGKERDVYYARVAAAFRAFNLKANTVGNMPFCLYKNAPANDPERKTNIKAIDEQAEGDEVDNSATWQNVVKFLPNPSELFRLDTLSYMTSNQIYNIKTGDVAGVRLRGLRHAIADSFTPWANVTGTALDYIERRVGTLNERYAPDGKPLTAGVKSSLVYMWRLDHTTELLPSPNTEALAIMEAAGVVYYKNFWIHNFYRRGGIKPTLISVKGLVDKDSKEEKEKSWSNWLKGVGSRWSNNIARIINGETMSAATIGDGVGDMKDNTIHQDALADIAMGVGMPLSLLVANSANYATAKEEKATWYENDIIPLCNWIAYEYNRQVFFPLGLRLEFHPETLDPQQEDETERAQAMGQYAAVLEKCPSKEIFMGLSALMGLEVPEELEEALEAYYAEKEQKEREMQEQMRQGGYTVGPDGKPLPAQNQPPKDGKQPMMDEAREEAEDKPKRKDEEKNPAPPQFQRKTWTPTAPEAEELRVWYEVAQRKLKRAEPMDFEYTPHHGGVPAEVAEAIKAKLLTAATAEDVRAAFVIAETVTPAPEYKTEAVTADPSIMALAQALNNLAEVERQTRPVKAAESMMPNINVTMPTISLTAQMPEQGTVTVNVPQQPAPVVNVTNQVQTPDVKVVNEVQPPKVVVMDGGPKDISIERNRDGKITGAKVK